MTTRQEAPINNSLLLWAREQAHLTIDEAVVRAAIKALKSKGLTAAKRLELWESGKQNPTLNELESIAKAYRRPLLTFFLSRPPRIETGLKDFRTVGDKPAEPGTPEYAAFRRQIEVLQREVRILMEEDGAASNKFVGSTNLNADIKELAFSMRDTLKFPFSDQQNLQTREELFNVLREHVEAAGIFVLKRADLGSHHSKILTDEFRGMVISDRYAPFIVVNPYDAKAAMVFTLIHELVHLWLGDSGISNYDALGKRQVNYQEREIFCNKVAAEFLVPGVIFSQEMDKLKGMELSDTIFLLTNKFKVSRVVIARRLLDNRHITSKTYWDLYNKWRDEWDIERKHLKDAEGGPGYFTKVKSQLGTKLLNTVITAAYDGKLSYVDASRLLGIKADYFTRLYTG